MRIDIEMEEEHRPCDPDLDQFVEELKSAGFPLEIGDVRMKERRGYGIIGPESEIVIKIDPETLRLLVEYAAALITLYKAHDYFGDFFKKAIEKLGENAGGKIAAIMGDVGSKTTFAFGDAGASARSRGSARGGAHGSLLPPPSAGSRGIPLATSGGSATIR